VSVQLVEVVILGLPLDLHRRAAEHQATLRRELAFVAAVDDQQSAPTRLRVLSDEVNGRFSRFARAQTEQLTAAIDGFATSIDVRFVLPVDVVEAVLSLLVALDEVDDFCRAGELLTLVTPPDLLAYRRWFLGEFVRQARDGVAPVRWTDAEPAVAAVGAAVGPATGRGPAEPVVVFVEGDLDLETAAELRGELAQRVEDGDVQLVIDLSGCTFMDSAGLSLLLTTRARCLDAGGRLRVSGLTRPVRRSMEIANVLDLLT
jgi:anti-anti-sigma factor